MQLINFISFRFSPEKARKYFTCVYTNIYKYFCNSVCVCSPVATENLPVPIWLPKSLPGMPSVLQVFSVPDPPLIPRLVFGLQGGGDLDNLYMDFSAYSMPINHNYAHSASGFFVGALSYSEDFKQEDLLMGRLKSGICISQMEIVEV